MQWDESEEDRFARERTRMVERQLSARGIVDERVLAAMERVPRHAFVPEPMREESYADHPLPIGEGQTISQPYIVALMTEALALEGPEKVLEIGTGSGYQTAILAELSSRVFTIERSALLSRTAEERLKGLGYTAIEYRIGDGTLGVPEEAPFHRILATGSLPRLPERLLSQLEPAGILVLPVGDRAFQRLVKVTRAGDSFQEIDLGACCFVPLIGEGGWPD
jgi:protein-L-isoaspartate(D-aspartate) O-methyltransferase